MKQGICAGRRVRDCSAVLCAALAAGSVVGVSGGTVATAGARQAAQPEPRSPTGVYEYDTCGPVEAGSGRKCDYRRLVFRSRIQKGLALSIPGNEGPATGLAKFKYPFAIFIKTNVSPRRLAQVTWTLECGRSNAAFNQHGSYVAPTDARHYLPLDLPNLDYCSVTVSATSAAHTLLAVRVFAETRGALLSDTVIASRVERSAAATAGPA